MLLYSFECNLLHSLFWILYKHEIYKSFHLFVSHILGIFNLGLLYQGVQTIRVTVNILAEWKFSTDKFIEQDSQRPIIGFEGVSFALKHFRRHIVRGSDNCERSEHIFRIEFFGCTHINQEYFSMAINDRILRFHISIDDVVHMKIFNSKQDAAEIVSSYWFVESGHFSDDLEHFFTFQVLHQQKDVLFVVECLDEAHYIRKYRLLQNFFLLNYTCLHLLLSHSFFRQAFDCIKLSTSFLVFDEEDLAKLAFTQLLDHLEVTNTHRLIFLSYAFLRGSCKPFLIFNVLHYFIQFLERKEPYASFAGFHKALANPVFLHPIFYVKEGSLRLIVDSSFKAYYQTSELVSLYFLAVQFFNALKAQNYFIQLLIIQLAKFFRSQQCPFLDIEIGQILQVGTQRLLNIFLTNSETFGLCFRLGLSLSSPLIFKCTFSKYLELLQNKRSSVWQVHFDQAFRNDVNSLGNFSGFKNYLPLFEFHLFDGV